MVTVMEAVVSPVLHNNDPVKSYAVNREILQSSIIVTIGADGTTRGAATPMPSGLAHPFTVWVTV